MGKRILVLMLALALGLAGCSSGEKAAESSALEPPTQATAADEAVANKTPPAEDAAATLDDYSSSMVIYTYYFSNMRANLLSQAYQNGFTDENMNEFWDILQNEKPIRDLLRETALQVTKEHAILYKMAEDAGTTANAEADTASDEQVDAFLTELGGDEQAFVDEYFITPEQMKTVGRRINYVDQYQEGVLKSQEVTEEEVLAAYEENKDLYDQVTVRHVLITTADGATEEEIAEAEKKAGDVLARMQNGEDVGALAAELSEDGGSKDNNGEYTFGRGEMVKPFEDWAFAAKVGDQGVVRTDYGFHVMEMMAEPSFENVKAAVEENVRIEKAQVVFENVIPLAESPDWVVSTAAIEALVP